MGLWGNCSRKSLGVKRSRAGLAQQCYHQPPGTLVQINKGHLLLKTLDILLSENTLVVNTLHSVWCQRGLPLTGYSLQWSNTVLQDRYQKTRAS